MTYIPTTAIAVTQSYKSTKAAPQLSQFISLIELQNKIQANVF
jgi:hypothetical protein